VVRKQQLELAQGFSDDEFCHVLQRGQELDVVSAVLHLLPVEVVHLRVPLVHVRLNLLDELPLILRTHNRKHRLRRVQSLLQLRPTLLPYLVSDHLELVLDDPVLANHVAQLDGLLRLQLLKQLPLFFLRALRLLLPSVLVELLEH